MLCGILSVRTRQRQAVEGVRSWQVALRRSGERSALEELTAARRRRRICDLDVFDAFYSAYLTGVALVVATVVGTTFVPDAPVDPATASRVAEVGGAWVGLVMALIVAVG